MLVAVFYNSRALVTHTHTHVGKTLFSMKLVGFAAVT